MHERIHSQNIEPWLVCSVCSSLAAVHCTATDHYDGRFDMNMERTDSITLEALIEAHEALEGRQSQDDDETPRPSTIVPRPIISVPPVDGNLHTNDVPDADSDSSSSTVPPTPQSPSIQASLQSGPLPSSAHNPFSNSGSATVLPQPTPLEHYSLNKFALWETKRKFYIIGSNTSESLHRVLKVDRTVQDELILTEDKTLYNEKQLRQLLRMLDDGNRTTGGFTRSGTFFGIAGK